MIMYRSIAVAVSILVFSLVFITRMDPTDDKEHRRSLLRSFWALSPRKTLTAESSCPAGHYAIPLSDLGGVQACYPVGKGFYSPEDDILRYKCDMGTASDSTTAEQCDPCDVGSFAPLEGLSECTYCPPGSYANNPGSALCNPCNPFYYNDVGSDYAIWLTTDTNGAPTNDLYCLEPLEPIVMDDDIVTIAPTAKQTLAPTLEPSFSPSQTQTELPTEDQGPIELPTYETHLPMPSNSPSEMPSQGNSADQIPDENAGDQDSDFTLDDDELAFLFRPREKKDHSISSKVILLPILAVCAIFGFLVLFCHKRFCQSRKKTAMSRAAIWKKNHTVPPPPAALTASRGASFDSSANFAPAKEMDEDDACWPNPDDFSVTATDPLNIHNIHEIVEEEPSHLKLRSAARRSSEDTFSVMPSITSVHHRAGNNAERANSVWSVSVAGDVGAEGNFFGPVSSPNTPGTFLLREDDEDADADEKEGDSDFEETSFHGSNEFDFEDSSQSSS